MSGRHAVVRLTTNTLVRHSEKRATSMSLPVVVHHRLDVLAELAAATSATRAEIIGMLISRRDLDVDQLEADVLDYRKKTVGQVMPPKDGESVDPKGDNVVELQVRPPGRPPRHAAS